MPGLVEMPGCMSVGRVIAATHVAALQAEPEVHPATVGLQTLFTSVWSARAYLMNVIEVRAIRCSSHERPPCGNPFLKNTPQPLDGVVTSYLARILK